MSVRKIGQITLVILILGLLIVACSPGDDGGVSVRDLQQTREASATEAVAAATEAVDDRIQTLRNIAPDGAVVDPELPSAGHDANIDIPFSPLPPTGGTHNPTWQKCDIYEAPVPPKHVIHSMEHGAVWVAYQVGLDADSVETLEDKSDRNAFVLMAPYPNLQSPVVLTAWGVQLELDSADDDRIDRFISAFANGPQTPEPGANCRSGNTTMEEG